MQKILFTWWNFLGIPQNENVPKLKIFAFWGISTKNQIGIILLHMLLGHFQVLPARHRETFTYICLSHHFDQRKKFWNEICWSWFFFWIWNIFILKLKIEISQFSQIDVILISSVFLIDKFISGLRGVFNISLFTRLKPGIHAPLAYRNNLVEMSLDTVPLCFVTFKNQGWMKTSLSKKWWLIIILGKVLCWLVECLGHIKRFPCIGKILKHGQFIANWVVGVCTSILPEIWILFVW